MENTSSQEDNKEAATAANNGDIFKPKTTPKAIRVLTVLAYILCVSMAAILLSVYYIFMWEGRPHLGARSFKQTMNNDSIAMMPSPVYTSRIFNTTPELETNPINYTEFWSNFINMSYKSNGIKLTKCDSKQWKTASTSIQLDATTASVKFAGEEAKDRLYEPKHKKKLVRVLTVVAYVFFVSLAAIMLSLYYLFLWNGDQRLQSKLMLGRHQQFNNKCDNFEEILRHIKQLKFHEPLSQSQQFPPTTSTTQSPLLTPPTATMTLRSTTWYNKELPYFENISKKNFLKKLLKGYYNSDILK